MLSATNVTDTVTSLGIAVAGLDHPDEANTPGPPQEAGAVAAVEAGAGVDQEAGAGLGAGAGPTRDPEVAPEAGAEVLRRARGQDPGPVARADLSLSPDLVTLAPVPSLSLEEKVPPSPSLNRGPSQDPSQDPNLVNNVKFV